MNKVNYSVHICRPFLPDEGHINPDTSDIAAGTVWMCACLWGIGTSVSALHAVRCWHCSSCKFSGVGHANPAVPNNNSYQCLPFYLHNSDRTCRCIRAVTFQTVALQALLVILRSFVSMGNKFAFCPVDQKSGLSHTRCCRELSAQVCRVHFVSRCAARHTKISCSTSAIVLGSSSCSLWPVNVCKEDNVSASWRSKPDSLPIVYCRIFVEMWKRLLLDWLDRPHEDSSKKKEF